MKIYNTLTKEKKEFEPIDKENNIVRMYSCGLTVYSYAHIGNMRTYIFMDTLRKVLKYNGYKIKHAMNITDVGHMTSDADSGEDKMLKGAKREGKTVYEIADFYTKAFLSDMEKLNIRIPKVIEKASDHIDTYIKMIEKLLDEDYAYISNGNVYFDISKAKDYYKLSGKNPDDLMIGVRETVEEDKSKRNPYDFVLWFTKSKFDEQELKWESPWGAGYPGWHIECSCISIKHLGEYLDIHCGGVDNIFPHHTNEIAQSEAYLGHKWCNYWFHVQHLNNQSGKMSKSKGGFLTIPLLEEKGYNPLVYRMFCLQSHYRKPLLFSFDVLDNVKTAYEKLLNKIESLGSGGTLMEQEIEEYKEQFNSAMGSDLNTSQALTVLYDVLKSGLNDASKRYLIEDFDKVLSLGLLEGNTSSKEISKELAVLAEKLIEERNQARKNKDFARADAIREELAAKGIEIKDTREGTVWSLAR